MSGAAGSPAAQDATPAREALEAALRRIERENEKLNAFTAITRARATPRPSATGTPTGPRPGWQGEPSQQRTCST